MESNRTASDVAVVSSNLNIKKSTSASRLESKVIPSCPPEMLKPSTKKVIEEQGQRCKFSETDYDLAKIIEEKRNRHESFPPSKISPEPSHQSTAPYKSQNLAGEPKIKHQTSSERLRRITSLHDESLSQFEREQKRLAALKGTDAAKRLELAEKLLHKILFWNVKWLHQMKDPKAPPNVEQGKTCREVKLSYVTSDDHGETYVPLLMHEIWCQAWDEYSNSNPVELELYPLDDPFGDSDIFIHIVCQAAVNKRDARSWPAEGDLVTTHFRCKLRDEDSTVMDGEVHRFGYVTDQTTETLTKSQKESGMYKGPKDADTVFRCIVRIPRKSSTIILDRKQPIKIKKIYYLRPMLRQIESIVCLPESNLCGDIINPRAFTCQFTFPSNTDLTKDPEFNESQLKAIIGTVEAIKRPYLVNKIQLIQGPPGTGKTHTLVGIIKRLFSNWDEARTPRVLVCAPSNGAVDEIARRLYKERHFLSQTKWARSLRIVRVGRLDNIAEDVKKVAYEQLVESNLKAELQSEEVAKRRAEMEKVIEQMDQMAIDMRCRGSPRDEINKAEEKAIRYRKELAMLANNKPHPKRRFAVQEALIKKADIILSTLNSCHCAPIERLYNEEKGNTFTCCIIDEASQCTEPEALMPLTFGFTKLVLIGDPLQLPATVKSPKAQECNYGTSLFERIFRHFGEYENKESPILMLNIQYRMNPEICRLPSKMFYDNRLVSHQSAQRRFWFRPYIVFDINDSSEVKDGSMSVANDLEADFVINVLKVMTDLIPREMKVKIGVVTPYQGQKKILVSKLDKIRGKLKHLPDVNTIDAFQGQERDIIILSCVRSLEPESKEGIGFLRSRQRMNVALTRAKYCNILCLSARSLQKDEMWQELLTDAKERGLLHSVPSTMPGFKLQPFIRVPKSTTSK